MGRKAKNNLSKAVTITESNIRMNFLYQASNLLAYTISKEIQSDTNKTNKTGIIKNKDKKDNAKNVKTNSNNSKDKLIKKRKRVPLRIKRNKYLAELNKNLKKDEFQNENAMDVDSDKTLKESKDNQMCSILNKDYPLLPLARYYNTTLGVVAQKTVSRMDPNVKRSICKYCKTPLIPGLTSEIQVDDNETKYVISCKSCQTKREFKSDNPNYSLFTERAALTTQEYEQYMNELSKDNKKGKR